MLQEVRHHVSLMGCDRSQSPIKDIPHREEQIGTERE